VNAANDGLPSLLKIPVYHNRTVLVLPQPFSVASSHANYTFVFMNVSLTSNVRWLRASGLDVSGNIVNDKRVVSIPDLTNNTGRYIVPFSAACDCVLYLF